MKIEFELVEKTFTPENGSPIIYYILTRQLADGNFLEIPIKKEKASLLNMSLKFENRK